MSPKLVIFLVALAYTTTTTTHASDPDPVQDFCIPISTTNKNCKNSSLAAVNDFVFSGLKRAGGPFSSTGFAGISVTESSFPGLNTLGMSIARADLKPGGLNVPHLHPRATEVAYVVAGTIYSGFIDTSNKVYAKVVQAGDVVVYPRGLIHFQMNVGNSTATVIGNFNSQNPGILRIRSALFGSVGLKDEVLEKAFGLSEGEIRRVRRKFFS